MSSLLLHLNLDGEGGGRAIVRDVKVHRHIVGEGIGGIIPFVSNAQKEHREEREQKGKKRC